MRREKIARNAGIVVAVTFICLAVFWVLSVSDVMGKFVPEEPYVTGAPESMSSIVVTNVGKNWQGEEGTGVKPCSTMVPTCAGKKGTETNPFVILEVVADKAQQQMTYLAADDDSTKPMDIMKMGIDLARNSDGGRSYVPGSSAIMQQDNLKSVGQWFCNYEYEVHKIGGDGDTEKIHYVDITKLYSLEITSDDLEKENISGEDFAKQYNTGITKKFSRDVYDVKSLSEKYPNFFEKDNEGKEIRKIAKEDNNNWDVSYERKILKEAVSETYQGKGFIVAVEPGKGDFGFASEEDCKNWVFTKTGTKADRWIYLESEEEIVKRLGQECVSAHNSWQAEICGDNFYNNNAGIPWQPTSNLYTKYNESEDITGLYMSLSNYGWYTCRYDIEPEIAKDVYSFNYWGIRNNNILKRQLFIFKNQKEYDDFHMQVITMSPSELNAMAKDDTDETADLIERADMFYIGGYDDATNGIENIYKMYYKYVKEKPDYEYDPDKVANFIDDDLEWDLCYKLIYRLCNNKNLPLVMTNTVGKLAKEGTEEIPMYQDPVHQNVSRRASLSNLSKLYIIATQFDLTAKKSEDEGYIRTFYDDILTTGKIEKIALGEKAKNTTDSPAQYTGYYERPKLAVSDALTEDSKKKCYYLWNTLTFYPEGLEYLWKPDNETQVTIDDDAINAFVSYGYMRSYFSVNDPSNLFSGGEQATRVSGSDGVAGNVAIPVNGVNGGYSTLLGFTESADVTNGAMNVAYLIMNNRPESINPQIVKVMRQKKEYVKMADNAVLLDRSTQDSFGDQKSYIKVQIHSNNNGEAGLVTKITLKNADGQKAPVGSALKLYKTKQCVTDDQQPECDPETYGSYTGYNIPTTDTLIAYVPYSLKQWADGYNIIEFETIGRIYSQRKKKIITGLPVKTEINIGERTLFNLE